MDAQKLTKEHLLVLGVLFALFMATLLLPQPAFQTTYRGIATSLRLIKRNATILGAVGLGILGLELGKQLYSCEWSIGLWYEYSIGPRFFRPWLGGYIGGSDFILTFIGNIFFASSLILPLALVGTRGVMRTAVACGELITLFILFCNGSRTTVALTLLVLALLWQFFAPNGLARLAGHLVLAATLVVMTSVMVNYRQMGYASSLAPDVERREIPYSQDDNYYRLIRIMYLADVGATPNWDAASFLTASFVNPIPRYYWPNKPLLTPEFFGDWKVSIVTVSYFGECIAMFGKWFGLACAFLFGLAYYQLLLRAYRLVTREFGVAAYLATCFYVYMAERSIQNVGMNAVFLMFVMGLYYWFQQPATPAGGRAAWGVSGPT
jgi:hypothetical protein